jgi:hypothetical protein
MWKVKYLIQYKDFNRWGESKAYGRRNAFEWVSLVGKAILEVHVYMSEKCIASYKRDKRGDMRRVLA